MAKAKKKTRTGNPLAELRTSLSRLRTDGQLILRHVKRDAKNLIQRSRSEAVKDMTAVRTDLERRANRTVRDVERRVLKQLHAASESQVRHLEQRIARLEKQVEELLRRQVAAA